MKAKKAALFILAIVVNLLIVGAVALAKQPPPPPPPPPPPNCKFVECANPDCLPGEHTEVPPGQCCPVCVPN